MVIGGSTTEVTPVLSRAIGRRSAGVVATLALVVSLVIGLTGAPDAVAATVIVVTTSADIVDPDDGLVSLREASELINTQPGDDTIQLAANTTYELTQCSLYDGTLLFRDEGNQVTIEGNGASIERNCPLTPTAAAGVLLVRSTALVVRDLTISGTGEGIEAWPYTSIPSGPTLVLERSTVHDTTKSCIHATTPSRVKVVSSQVRNCGGSGVLVGSFGPGEGSLELIDSEVSGVRNEVSPGTFAAVEAPAAVITRSSIHDNPGGGAFAWGAATVSESHIDRNGAPMPGLHAGPLTASDTTIDDNVAYSAPVRSSLSAGLLVRGTSSLTRVSVSRNKGAHAGISMSSEPTSLTVADSHIDGNEAVDSTGAPDLSAGINGELSGEAGLTGQVQIVRSTVDGNVAKQAAGLQSARATAIVDSTFRGNTVLNREPAQPSGAVVVENALVMSGSTVSGTTVAPVASALPSAAISAKSATLTNDTIVGNTADVGGVLLREGGSLRGVTLDDNRGATAQQLATAGPVSLGATALGRGAGAGPTCAVVEDPSAPSAVGSITSVGYNVATGSTCPFAPAATDLVDAGDLRLAPLAISKGASPTRVPLPQSPLRDRIPVAVGSLCSGVDQRGVVRPQGAGCDVGAVEAEGSRFHAVAPTRILDTRVDVLPGGSGKVVAGVPLKVPVAGGPRELVVRGGGVVPLSAAAVVLNVTVTGSSANSFLTVWPAGSPQPNASAVNFGAGQTIPNLVTAKVGEDGHVVVATNQGVTDVVVDLFGWFDDGSGSGSGSGVGAGDGWSGIDPVRVLDSRTLTGGWGARLVAGAPRELVVRGVAGIPVDASAVVANVTVTGSSANSFLSLWPAGGARPASSNVNFAVGETIANGVIVPVGAGGKVMVATAVGATDVVVDVTGYFTAAGGSRFFAVGPTRVLDDREGVGAVGPWLPGQTRAVGVTGGPVAANAVGVAANVTVTNGSAGSFLSVFPHGVTKPSASSINFGPGQTIANQAMVRVGGGQVDIFNQLGKVDVIADVVGYYSP